MMVLSGLRTHCKFKLEMLGRAAMSINATSTYRFICYDDNNLTLHFFAVSS